MGIKLSSIIMIILGIFIAKISFENINQGHHAQAQVEIPEQTFPQSRAAASSANSEASENFSTEKIN